MIVGFILIVTIWGLRTISTLHTHYRRRLHTCLWVGWFVIQYVYVWGTYSIASSDCWVVHNFAFDFVRNSNVYVWYIEYFSMYSNNILLGIISIVMQKLIPFSCMNDVWLFTSLLACILADLAIYWALKMIIYNFGEQYYEITFLLACILIGLSEEATILYSDILSLWTLPFAGFYIGKSIKENDIRRKYINYLYTGLALGFGSAIKPQMLIFLFAWIIMLLIQIGIQKIDALRPILLGIIVCIVLCAGLSDIGKRWFCNAIISKYEEHSQEYFENTEFSYLHWMNMGLNEESMGGYSLEDVEATKAIVGKKNKSAALKESIKDRLSAFGFGGYLQFLNGKVIYALQNGSFSEGVVWKGTCINNAQTAKKLQKCFLSTSSHWKYGAAVLIQITYLGCLWLSNVNAIVDFKTKKSNFMVQIAQITLLGDIMFLALFERNMRYFFSVLPLLIFLAISGLNQFSKQKRG